MHQLSQIPVGGQSDFDDNGSVVTVIRELANEWSVWRQRNDQLALVGVVEYSTVTQWRIVPTAPGKGSEGRGTEEGAFRLAITLL